MPIYFLLSTWVLLSVGREPTPQAYFERGALFYNALTAITFPFWAKQLSPGSIYISEPGGTTTDCRDAITVLASVALPNVVGLELKSAVPENQNVTLPDWGWAVKPAAQGEPTQGSSEVFAMT